MPVEQINVKRSVSVYAPYTTSALTPDLLCSLR